jgi:adenosine 3'-phospho 5'-phosphosulfate transporter B2
MTKPYGEDPNVEFFTYSAFLVLSNRVFAGVFALIVATLKKESLRNVAPLYTYMLVALSNAMATFCQYEALKFVRFVTYNILSKYH